MMKQIKKIFLCFFLLISILIPVHANDRGFYIANDESGIPDTALYEYIKIQTKQNEVYSNDLVGVEELTLSDRVYSIRSLKGLSKMNLADLKSLTLDISTLSTLEDVLELTMLQELRITNSSLTQLPEDIHLLDNLHSFELNHSMVTYLPDNFYTMGSLNALTLNSVPLEGIGKDIEKLQFLDEINLINMHISIPEELYTLVHLKKIRFSGMQATTLSHRIAELNHLEELYLDNNQFTEIPAMVFDIPSLQKLSLQSNQLTNVSTEIDRLINLSELDLSYNQLETLPIQLTNLSNLRVLSINDNLIACLPSDFSLLKLDGVYDFFKYNEIQKCGAVPEVTITTVLSFEDKELVNGGYTNKDVVVQSNNPVYFMVDNITDTEVSTEKVISGEGKHVVSAVEEVNGIVATVSFTIDKKAPSIAIQGNDMKSDFFKIDVAIESNEEGYFVINGERISQKQQMIILSENGEYEVYQEDSAGNRSNTLSFSINKEVVKVIEEKKEFTYLWYLGFMFVVAVLAWGTHHFLRQGAENDRKQ